MLSFKVLCVLSCLVAFAAAYPNEEGEAKEAPAPGSVQELSGDDLKEAEKHLQHSLEKLASDSDDGHHCKISKIHSASRQSVNGTLYRYKADLANEKDEISHCDISILLPPSSDQETEVTFECEGHEKEVRKHKA